MVFGTRLSFLAFQRRINMDHTEKARSSGQVIESFSDLDALGKKLRLRKSVRVIHLDPQPVRLGSVVGKMESAVVDVDAAKFFEITSRFVDFDAILLLASQAIDPDLEARITQGAV